MMIFLGGNFFLEKGFPEPFPKTFLKWVGIKVFLNFA